MTIKTDTKTFALSPIGPVEPPRAIRWRIRLHLVPVAAYFVLTAALTWPLALRVNVVVPQDLGDPLLSMWTLWWNAHVMPFTDRWWDGIAFFPAARTMTLSDHRVGLSIIATPMMWMGASPLTAHNVVFLLTFFLSAVAAYALCFVVTRSRAAAFLGGLVFGFNPFRAGHLAHLELLASYWLPIILLTLHQWLVRRQSRWLVMLAGALLMQALTSGYYFFYAGVLVALWLAWFARRLMLRDYLRLAMAGSAPLIAIAPVLLEYRRAHAVMGLSRGITEIESLSADVISLLTAPGPLVFWRSPDAWYRPEGELLPGLTAVILVAIGLLLSSRSASSRRSPSIRALRACLLAGAAAALSAAAMSIVVGPVAFGPGGFWLSITDAYKPMAIGVLMLTAWAASTDRMLGAWTARSSFAFYILATPAMWLLAMGPTVRFLGERIIYKAPYAWLMLLPGFRDEFRAPSRFAMLAILTLSVAAALAFARLVSTRAARARVVIAAAIGVAIMAESWTEPLPLPTPPVPLTIPAAVPRDAAILEWPLGEPEAAAMYRSIAHGRRTVNGMSGYVPAHTQALQAALTEGRVDALTPLTAHGPIAIFIPSSYSADIASLLTRGIARSIGSTDTHEVLLVPPTAAAIPERGANTFVTPSRVSDADGTDLPVVRDDDRQTAWVGGAPQWGGEQVTADLGERQTITGVVLALGQHAWAFPRHLVIAMSTDGVMWTDVWSGETARASVAAAIADPRDVRVPFMFDARPTRFIRLTQTGQSRTPWAIAEMQVAMPSLTNAW